MRGMTWAVFTAVAAIVFANPGGVFAEEKKAEEKKIEKPQESGFGAVDADKDGKVSDKESEASAHTQFALFDVNKDGKVSSDEFKAQMTLVTKHGKKPTEEQIKLARKIVEARYARLDTDKSGDISEQEIKADTATRQKVMDLNKDGFVTRDEIKTLQEKMKAAQEKKAADLKKKKEAEAKDK